MKCPSCGYENREGARYCSLCQTSFVKANTGLGGLREPSASYGLDPLAEPRREGVQAVLQSRATGENWFQRHLNWTWVLPQLFLIIVGMFVLRGLLVSFIVSMGPTSIMDPTALPSVLPSLPFSIFVIFFGFVGPLLGLASVWGIGAWVLKRKSRSLWWLLIFLLPIAATWLNVFLGLAALVIEWIIFLRLENYSVPPPLPESPGSSIQPGSTIQPGLAPPGLGSGSDKYGP